jgi:hypothetical protein
LMIIWRIWMNNVWLIWSISTNNGWLIWLDDYLKNLNEQCLVYLKNFIEQWLVNLNWRLFEEFEWTMFDLFEEFEWTMFGWFEAFQWTMVGWFELMIIWRISMATDTMISFNDYFMLLDEEWCNDLVWVMFQWFSPSIIEAFIWIKRFFHFFWLFVETIWIIVVKRIGWLWFN